VHNDCGKRDRAGEDKKSGLRRVPDQTVGDATRLFFAARAAAAAGGFPAAAFARIARDLR